MGSAPGLTRTGDLRIRNPLPILTIITSTRHYSVTIPPRSDRAQCVLSRCLKGCNGVQTRDNLWVPGMMSKWQISRETECAPGGTRTPDPLLRRQLLYPPELQARRGRGKKIGESGFEPPTSCSQGRRASRDAPLPVPFSNGILTPAPWTVNLRGRHMGEKSKAGTESQDGTRSSQTPGLTWKREDQVPSFSGGRWSCQ